MSDIEARKARRRAIKQAAWDALSAAEQAAANEAKALGAMSPAERGRAQAMAAVARLVAAGGPGLQRRVGVTHERKSSWWRDVYLTVEIELEPAWPVGTWGWSGLTESAGAHETGLTPSGTVVPMAGPSFAEHQAGSAGGVAAYHLISTDPRLGRSPRSFSWEGQSASWEVIAVAMQRLVERLL